jgi:hypothetical protein
MLVASVLSALALAAAGLVVGCTAETTSADRTSVPTQAPDAGADADAATQAPDPSGGRDDNAASCYAACQNTAFTCQTKGASTTAISTAELAVDERGCSGTIVASGAAAGEEGAALKLDCHDRTICKADAPGQPATACVAGVYSAFSFAYALAGGGTMVCTRN